MKKLHYAFLGFACLYSLAGAQIKDLPVTVLDSHLCELGPGHLFIDNTEIGVNYTFRTSNNSVIVGPVAGSGGQLTCNFLVSATDSYNVLAEAVHSAGLAFDGTDDYIAAPVPASFEYQNAFTFEAWVKTPDPSTGNYEPTFFIGNNTYSDIEVYVRPNDLIVLYERGKPGLNSRTYPSPPDDVWFHLAVVYNGSTTTVYYDGVQQTITSGTAAGTLTKSTATEMDFGVAPNITVTYTWQRYLEGQMDDIRIWDYARTGAEIANNMSTCLSGLETGLKAYYPLNGTNGETSAIDLAGSNHGTLNMDPNSSWVIVETPLSPCASTASMQMAQTPTIALTSISNSVGMSGNTLTALQGGATYQWYNCNTFSPMAGETAQSFTATASGSYAVVIDFGGCVDTSFCQNVTIVGVSDPVGPGFSLAPNPTTDGVTLHLDKQAASATIQVRNALGQLLSSHITAQPTCAIQLPDAPGIYFVSVACNGQVRTQKVLKQ